MFKIFGLMACCFVSVSASAADEIYRYSDINGQAYFSNQKYAGAKIEKVYSRERMSPDVSSTILRYNDVNEQAVFTNYTNVGFTSGKVFIQEPLRNDKNIYRFYDSNGRIAYGDEKPSGDDFVKLR